MHVSPAKIALHDYQETVTTGQTETRTDRQTGAGKGYTDAPLCFVGDKKVQRDIRKSKFRNMTSFEEIGPKFDWVIFPEGKRLLLTCLQIFYEKLS